jgi:hypothetical protein
VIADPTRGRKAKSNRILQTTTGQQLRTVNGLILRRMARRVRITCDAE